MCGLSKPPSWYAETYEYVGLTGSPATALTNSELMMEIPGHRLVMPAVAPEHLFVPQRPFATVYKIAVVASEGATWRWWTSDRSRQ